MFRLIIFLLCVSLCICSTPISQGKHFQAYKLQDDDFKTKRQEVHEITKNGPKSIIEIPTNGTVPLDDGSAEFGDMEIDITNKTGELIIRDTIVNQIHNENLRIRYNRTLPGYYVEDVRVFNVGRQRGFVQWAVIYHYDGYVETEILVAAYNTVRMFVEIYVRV